MSKKLLLNALLAGVAILVVLAIITILPNSSTKTTVCPFAPWSTLMLLVTAGVLWVVRDYVIKRVD